MKTTTPLAKSYQTAEFWIVVAANIALVVIPIVSSALPADLAAKVAGTLNVVYVLSRALVKSLSTPADPVPPPAIVIGPPDPVVTKALGEVSDADEYAGAPTEWETTS